MDRDTMSPELEILYAARTTADDKCVAAKAVYMQHVYYGTTGTPASKAAAAAFRAAWAAWRLASAEYLDALAAVTPAHRTRYQETARQYRDMAA